MGSGYFVQVLQAGNCNGSYFGCNQEKMEVVTSSEAGVVECPKVNNFKDGGAQDAVRSSLNRVEEKKKADITAHVNR